MVERLVAFSIMVITAVITLVIAIFAWRRRDLGRSASFLSICTVGVTIYSFGYGMELISDTLQTAMFWVRFQHWGIQVIAPAWLLFALVASGHENRVSKKLVILLSIIPIYLFLNAQTLGWLNLGHHNPHMDTSGAYPVFSYDRNFFNYLAIGYYLFCLLVSIYLFVLMLVRSATSFRQQAAIFLVGSLFPFFPLIDHNLALTNTYLDLTPVALGISGLFFLFGILKFQILDIIPLARDAIFENIHVGALILDLENRVIDFNPALQQILSDIEQTLIGKPAGEVFINFPSLVDFISNPQSERTEFRVADEQETAYYWINQSIMKDRRGHPIGKVVAFSDYTAEKNLLTALEMQASLDGLTGVYNRQHFDKIAAREASRIKRYGGDLSLLMLDLDHFKQINDLYGHAAGDHVLVATASILSNNIRQPDVLARFGGDEFLILLPETNILSARRLAERLCTLIDQAVFKFEGNILQVSASIGAASIEPGNHSSLTSLYRSADRAMYHAKKSGGSQVSFEQPDLTGQLV